MSDLLRADDAEDAAAGEAPPRLSPRTVAAIASGFVVFGIAEATWSSRIPYIRQHLHLSDLGLSLALMGPAAGQLLATVIVRRLSSQVGSARIAAAAICLTAATLVLPALAWNLPTLTIALVLWGASLGSLDIGMNAQGVALERKRGHSIMSRLHSSYSVTVLAFAPIGSLATTLGVGPPWHFAFMGLFILLATWPVRGSMLPDAHTPTWADEDVPAREMWRRLAPLGVIGFCAFIGEGAVGNWSGVLLHHNDHASLAAAPFGLTTFSVGMVIGRLSGDAVITRIGYRATSRAAGLIAAAGMALGALSPGFALALVGYLVMGLGLSVLVPIIFALTGRTPGGDPVHSVARLTTAAYVGIFVGPPVVGLVASATTLRVALMCVAGLLVVAAAVADRIVRD